MTNEQKIKADAARRRAEREVRCFARVWSVALLCPSRWCAERLTGACVPTTTSALTHSGPC